MLCRLFSSFASRGYSPVEGGGGGGRRLLTVVALLVAEHRFWCPHTSVAAAPRLHEPRPSGCDAQA